MFISKAEKKLLFFRIEQLFNAFDVLADRVSILEDFESEKTWEAIEKLSGKKGRTWTPEQRARQSEVLKAHHAKKKEAI